MKQVIKWVFVIMIMIAVTSVSVFSCTKRSSPSEMSEESLLKMVEKDAKKEYGTNSKIYRYYGVFGESVAVGLNGFKYDMIWEEEVDGVLFTGSSIQEIMIWKDGKFCDFRDAVDKGFLTVEQLEDLANINNNLMYKEYTGNQ